MSLRSLGRYLVPLALVAVLVTTVVVVSSTTGGGGEKADGGSQLTPAQQRKRERRKARRRQLRESGYVVRPGDTMDVISERTRVPREQLIELNPEVDPQALQPGQRLKLR